MVSARKWTERRTTTWHVNPSKGENRKIIDRSYEDRYNDPGFPMRERNNFGRSVLILLDEGGRKIFMSGNGASQEGDMPFVDEFDLETKTSKRLWRCAAPYYESAVTFMDKKDRSIITRRESKDEPTNYYIRGMNDNSLKAITCCGHPSPQMNGRY